jgi:hypothetical protein
MSAPKSCIYYCPRTDLIIHWEQDGKSSYGIAWAELFSEEKILGTAIDNERFMSHIKNKIFVYIGEV